MEKELADELSACRFRMTSMESVNGRILEQMAKIGSQLESFQFNINENSKQLLAFDEKLDAHSVKSASDLRDLNGKFDTLSEEIKSILKIKGVLKHTKTFFGWVETALLWITKFFLYVAIVGAIGIWLFKDKAIEFKHVIEKISS